MTPISNEYKGHNGSSLNKLSPQPVDSSHHQNKRDLNSKRGVVEEKFHNTWLFSEESFLSRSPSRKLMTLGQELQTRELMYAFLIKLGIELKLDGRTILAATVYINRFYMRMPITTSKYFFICAAIAISCKLHDCYREPDRIALKACEIRNPNQVVDQHHALFWQWRDQLLYREEIMLKMLNFELNLELPYDFVETLQEKKTGNQDDGFIIKQADIIKHTLSKVELLSAWPLLVSYGMKTIFGMCFILTVREAQDKFIDEVTIKLPSRYIESKLEVPVVECYHCYKYILKLKSVCQDSKLPCHKNIVAKLTQITKERFYDVASGKCPEPQLKLEVNPIEEPLILSDAE